MRFLIFLTCIFGFINVAHSASPGSNLYSGYQGYFNPNFVTSISSGATATPSGSSNIALTSGSIRLSGFSLVGVMLPVPFTGTSLTFRASSGGVVYLPIRTSAGVLTYPVTSGAYIAINPDDLRGVNFLQIFSNSTETGNRILNLSLKGL